MPRFFISSERKPRGEQRSFRTYVPWWVDPFFAIKGSSIEKMVMAELARRGVYFMYRPQGNNLGGFVPPDQEADFLLPQHKIWIEVQGSYFHSKPGQIENDAMRYAEIEMAGWKPVFLWEFDIRNRLIELMDEIGVFYQVDRSKEAEALSRYGASQVYDVMQYEDANFSVGRELVDQLKGLRKALAQRTTQAPLIVRRRTGRRPKV